MSDAKVKRGGWRTEDAMAVFLGVGALAAVLASVSFSHLFLEVLGINPAGLHWSDPSQLVGYFGQHWVEYATQGVLLFAVFVMSAAVIGLPMEGYVAGFLVLYGLGLLTFVLSGWARAAEFELEPPVIALLIGLLLANAFRLPAWLQAGWRVEYYVKLGIVLLGATFPLSLLVSVGPIAILQASIVAIATATTIYLVGTRIFHLDRRLSAVLATGGSVCGVSASMAVSAAVGARRQDIYQSITLVIVFALAMIVLLPALSQILHLPAGQAGAWIGTSEFADAAGIAAASQYGHMVGHQGVALQAFTAMKVVGRDAWIGIWSFFWSFLAVRWQMGRGGHVSLGREVWGRFPKFLIGFLACAVTMSLVTASEAPVLLHATLAPLVTLRTWAFVLCFLSIGLTTRFRDLPAMHPKAAVAFALGVVVNLGLGYLLSVVVFGATWAHLG